MKIILTIILLTLAAAAQTHTTAVLDANNIFTGTNTFQGLSATSVIATSVSATSITSSNLASGNCVQAGAGGFLTTVGTPCQPAITFRHNSISNSSQTLLNLIAGANVTITDGGGGALTIAATGGGGGGVTEVDTGTGLTGGPITGTGTISLTVLPLFAEYTFSVSGGIVTAVNNATGASTTGSDTAALVNTILGANATTGGRLYFKNGVYPINSMTAESATGCSSFGGSGNLLAYAFGFPSNTPYANSVQWLIEGESTAVWVGEAGQTTANTNGVIFNVTSTAVSSVAANSVLAGIWMRPVTNCTLTGSNTSNDIRVKNVAVRFPTNQRGNTIAFALYFAGTVGLDNVLADFALPYNSIATGSAPVVGSYNSIGITSSVSSAGNYQNFDGSYVVGYNIAYDFQSEHITGTTDTAIYNNYAAYFGRSGTTVYHPSSLTHFVDQENLNGIQLGAQMAVGSRIDLTGLDFELGIANWYARATPAMVETNAGSSTGLISYTIALQGTGVFGGSGSVQLFSSGGGNITQIGNPSNLARTPIVDTFTRADAASLGPGWNTTGGTWAISSNQATPTAGNTPSTATFLIAALQGDQFASVVGNSLTTSNQWGPGIRYTSAGGINGDSCAPIGTGTNQLQLFKVIAGAYTSLAAPSYTPTNGDLITIFGIGSLITCTATRSGTVVAVASGTDATNTGGLPWLYAAKNAAATSPFLTNFKAGSLPTLNGTSSIYSQPAYFPTYNTLTNCAVNSASPAACGSASSGAVVIPTTTTSYTINSTAVTSHSRIQLTWLSFASDLPSSPTCVSPAITSEPTISNIVSGVSFTITMASTSGQTCPMFDIKN